MSAQPAPAIPKSQSKDFSFGKTAILVGHYKYNLFCRHFISSSIGLQAKKVIVNY